MGYQHIHQIIPIICQRLQFLHYLQQTFQMHISTRTHQNILVSILASIAPYSILLKMIICSIVTRDLNKLVLILASADTISSLFNNNNLMGHAAAARKYSDYAVSGIGAAAAHHAHYAAAAHHASPYTQSHHYDPLTAATNFSPVSSAATTGSTANSVGGSGMMSHTNATGW